MPSTTKTTAFREICLLALDHGYDVEVVDDFQYATYPSGGQRTVTPTTLVRIKHKDPLGTYDAFNDATALFLPSGAFHRAWRYTVSPPHIDANGKHVQGPGRRVSTDIAISKAKLVEEMEKRSPDAVRTRELSRKARQEAEAAQRRADQIEALKAKMEEAHAEIQRTGDVVFAKLRQQGLTPSQAAAVAEVITGPEVAAWLIARHTHKTTFDSLTRLENA